MARELPQDIIENNILTRLPVKSLIRFTSVSKRWRSVILYNPKFAKSQFESSSKTHRILVSSNASPELKSLDFESPWFGHASSFRKLHFPFEQQPAHCNFLGSSNGLVFVALDDKRFYIWNPSTRLFKQLPGIGYPSNRSAVSMYYGAGYLSATDNYKVMIAYMLDSQEEEEEKSVEAVHVLSLKAPIWRMGNADSLGTDIFPCLQGTLSNEVLHWLYEYSYSRYDLVAFDLASEEFRIMQLPDLDDDGRSLYRCQLGVVGGGLCVASYTDVAITCDSVDFWVMREYGVRESWTKVFNLDFSNLPVQPLLENLRDHRAVGLLWKVAQLP
ncbi:hypothetical protein ACLB2K_015074 [Fragaria x ananassa]